MKKLKNYDVLELNTQEKIGMVGGTTVPLWVVNFAIEIEEAWDGFTTGIESIFF
jgi:hypothetical protein